MTGAGDWKNLLTASERYEHIQKIQQALDSNRAAGTEQRSAFVIENEAYQASDSREAYDAACRPSTAVPVTGTASSSRSTNAGEGSGVPPPPAAGSDDDYDRPRRDGSSDEGDDDDGPGIRIGSYRNCRYVASGVTAEVYRCRGGSGAKPDAYARALKVIVETHNMAPHDPIREAKILAELRPPCVPLLETFRDQEQRLVLVFPYMPLTLADVLEQTASGLPRGQIRSIFCDVFRALADIHVQGIIHRDVKPTAILLRSPTGPALLSDFGTAWHPRLSLGVEPADAKILDVGTGPYRAPEVLFGDGSYGAGVDMWAAGAALVEACRRDPPGRPLFESRAAHEDGNQLGLILSIFKTIGSPTRETWPEAERLRTPPFEMYRFFEGRPWAEVLRGVEPEWVELIVALVRYGGRRATAEQALQFECMRDDLGKETSEAAAP